MKYFEDETTDLKSSFTDDIKKEIISFANTRGGKIYIGICDDGTVCGVINPDETIQKISNTVRDSIKPDVTVFVGYEILSENGLEFIKLTVQCGNLRPYYLSSKGLTSLGVFVRQGTSCVPASDIMIRRMIKETDGDNYEDLRSLNQDLTFEKAKLEFLRRNIPFENEQMRSLGITDEGGIYTNLGLLLSDQCPHIIKAATFTGTDSLNFHDRTEFSGSLLKQLEDAYEYMELRNNLSATFDKMIRTDHVSYPQCAMREALLNAIVHRDYGFSAPTLLSVYDDRMDILSIGRLYNISYDDMMLGVSSCRNEKLAKVFYRLGLIESYGTGIGKIMASYEESKVKPSITVSQGALKTSLPNLGYKEKVIRKSTEISSSINKVNYLIDVFKAEKILTRSDVEKILNVSTSSARRILIGLIKSGRVTEEGQGKNSLYRYIGE